MKKLFVVLLIGISFIGYSKVEINNINNKESNKYSYGLNIYQQETSINIIFVDSSAAGANNGTSWSDAFTSFQEALEAAISGDTIWVAKGTYYPSSGYSLCDNSGDSTRYYHFEMKEGVKIFGGFDGNENPAIFNLNDRDFLTNNTILSADIGTLGDSTDNCYHVFYHPAGLNLTASAVLNGFAITRGNADGRDHSSGGGIYNYSYSSPTLTNVTISRNTARLNGGGMYNNYFSSPTLTNVTISGNTVVDYGGGIFNNSFCSPTLTNVTISGNIANYGGGIFNMTGCSTTLTDVTISGNIANYGGGMYNNSSKPTLTNVMISGNTAVINGGGIFNILGSPILTNITISDNSANNGGGVYHKGGSLILNNSIISGNRASSGNEFYNIDQTTYDRAYAIFNYSCYDNNSGDIVNAGTFTTTNHNITVDPQFADAANGDYRLFGNSPCVDAGDSSYNNTNYDIRGIGFGRKLLKTDSTQIGAIDMGAYEYKNGFDLKRHNIIIFVDSSAAGANTGTNWTDAFSSFQEALETAISGDTIWVAKGTYFPSSSYTLTNTTRFYHFEMKEGVKIYGGFDGNENPAIFNLNDRDFSTNRTILSGDLGTYGDSTDNCYHVFYHSSGLNLTASAILDGFTITEGNADGTIPHYNGGGMYNFRSSPTLSNVTICGNTATSIGGGMYNNNSSPTLTNDTIRGNTANYGGGVLNYESSTTLTNVLISQNIVYGGGGGGMFSIACSPILTNVTISENIAADDGYGGGICNFTGSPILTNVTISGNMATDDGQGGGVYNEDSSPILTNVVINGNRATWGGGICNWDSSPILTNVTICKNTAAESGGGLFTVDSSFLTFNNSIIWGNTASYYGNEFFIPNGNSVILNYSCYGNHSNDITNYGTFTATNHNITLDPLFVDENGNYRLFGNSPCIDAGDSSYNTENYDIRGVGFGRKLLKTDSTQIGAIDMGAYEYINGFDSLVRSNTIFYVDSSAAGTNNGTSWINAFTSLQSALDVAIPGDTIWVAKGTYYPSSGYNLCDDSGDSTRYYHFEMKEGVKIYGGFTGNEDPTVCNLNDRNFSTNRAILSGDIGIHGDSTDNCYHVFYHPYGLNLTPSSILDGFTITGGNADDSYPHTQGGGMYNFDSSSPTLTNVIITGNSALDYGGGISNEFASSPILTNVKISNNTSARNGGGMFIYDHSSPILTNVTISGNTAADNGGGIFIFDSSSPTFNNVTISKNTAANFGGGLYIFYDSSPLLNNVTISENIANNGGGIYFRENSSASINNSIIWGNKSIYSGNELFIENGNSVILNYCCYNNHLNYDIYNQGTFDVTNHNTLLNPHFVDAINNDYRLYGSSPCVDAGNNEYNTENYDIRGVGFGRKLLKTDATQTGPIDMGAYEFKNGVDPLFRPHIIFVNFDASGSNTGTNWTDAFTSFQEALETAIFGDTIWVAKGTYYPSSGYNLCDDSGDSTRYYHFEMIEGVKIFGGFAGNEDPTVFNLNDRDFTVNRTILSGNINHRRDNSDYCYHVYYHPDGLDLTSLASLDGFTITEGNADGVYPHNNGGGMYNESSSPNLTNVTISNNTAFVGGGVYNLSSSPTLTNVTISKNSSKGGGGIYNYSYSSPTLNNVSISENTTIGFGGGMYNYSSSSPILTNVTISGNTARLSGGGMFNYSSSSPTLTNVIVCGNTTTSGGGGIMNFSYSSPTLNNVTISGNTADEGGGIYFLESSSSILNNSIISGNTASSSGNEFYIESENSVILNYCCYDDNIGDIDNAGTFTATNHNITLNPLFVDTTNNDYRLYGNSPCVDAGDSSYNTENYDIRGVGFGRKLLKTDSSQAGPIDMGAYEYKEGTDNTVSFTWTGAVSSEWNTVGNWDIPGLTPNQSDNVIIPDSATTIHDLLITDTTNRCHVLSIQPGGLIIVDKTGKLSSDSLYNADAVTEQGVLLLWDNLQHGKLFVNGISYGKLSEVNTGLVSIINNSSALLNGSVSSTGFYHAPIRGFVYSLNDSTPTIGETGVIQEVDDSTGRGLFSDIVTALTDNQLYYYRAFAINGSGISYGEINTFITLPLNCGPGFTIADIDGNVYETVQIGHTCWTKQNMKTTRYANGDLIRFAEGYYAEDYPNEAENVQRFGRLYSWYSAVGVPENSIEAPTEESNHYIQGICPDGWYLPDDNIFDELLAWESDALRSDSLWLNGLNGTNYSGFNALPAGLYNVANGKYCFLLGNTFFWSSNSEGNMTAKYVELQCHCPDLVFYAANKGNGYSIRCVKR